MTAVMTAFGVYLNDLPYFLLCMSLMWNHLRGTRRRAWLVMIGVATAHAVSIMCLMTFYENWPAVKVPHELFFLLVFGAGLIVSVRLKVTRLLFAFFMVKFYADLVTAAAKFLEVTFWPYEGHLSFSVYFNLMHFVLLLLTYPLMWRYISTRMRTLFLVESGIWRYLWLLPTVFYGLNMAYAALNTQIIHSAQYVLFSLILFGGSLLVYALIQDFLKQASENAVLKASARMAESLLNVQREQYGRIAQNIEQTKAARHDIRHQLAAIGRLTGEEKVKSYIGELLGAIPEAPESMYCENHAVNAVVTHYLAAAATEEINADVRFHIPEKAGRVSEMDLCVVMGNLLENAVEACRRTESGEKFIRARSGVEGAYLSMIVENSFDGLRNGQDGTYLSRKHDDGETPREGVGLSSVKAVCAKYNGLVKIEVTGNVWHASVLVDMGERPT